MDSRLMDNHILVPIDHTEQQCESKTKRPKPRKHGDCARSKESGKDNIKNLDDLTASLMSLQEIFGALHNDFRAKQGTVMSPEYSAYLLQPPTEKVQIYVSVIFVKLGEIDTLKETFSADVLITSKWQEPRLTIKPQGTQNTINGSQFWDPELFIENFFGEPTKETIWYTAAEKDGVKMLYQKRRLKATFIETIELGRFPFDTQDLQITSRSNHPENLVTLHPDYQSHSSVNLESFVDQQEWSLQSNIKTEELSGSPQLKSPSERRSGISVACKAKRRPGYFIWNILLVMIFICSLAFTTFSVSVTLPQNRLQLTFTLVLTMVTFKFIVNNSLPKISYLTYLDKYVLVSMGILILIGVWHAIIAVVIDTENFSTVKRMDTIALIIIGLLYVAFNVTFAVWVYLKTRPEKVKKLL